MSESRLRQASLVWLEPFLACVSFLSGSVESAIWAVFKSASSKECSGPCLCSDAQDDHNQDSHLALTFSRNNLELLQVMSQICFQACSQAAVALAKANATGERPYRLTLAQQLSSEAETHSSKDRETNLLGRVLCIQLLCQMRPPEKETS